MTERAEPGEDMALSLRDITVRFGGVCALDHVSIDVPKGSVSGLIGPNGAGKSTLLAVASGLQPVDTGRILVDTEDLTGARPQRFARARMSRTFQAPQLVPEIDVRQHILLGLRSFRSQGWNAKAGALVRGITRSELDRAERLLAELGLSEVARRSPMELPLGLRRLVEVAQCIATDPRILLLDEPSAGLNRVETQAFAAIVSRLSAERGIAVLLVEHDMDLVLEISEQLFVLDFGELIASGATEDVTKDQRVRDAYLGTVKEGA
ncbi:ABC transporter ATP-binding protein [Peterkaempfera bronchialis]|uniref:ATP-binding cassette domain-containing protein n=1 Tax=Peterkaempfera bronchialis TaxID=2126346 RepID=A0A345T514_9ACTN|nr:ATP-binding cassette domain-containing protein [Peterkaempfera bronchialis]AXI81069.1 ATP-binding cassette domain-containing protein [Peterkaempfera bronchialis]